MNTELVQNPSWTGRAGEYAIIVGRGEPARTDLQMEQAVAKQMRDYVLHYTSARPSDVVFALTTQLIARDYIAPAGLRTVTLTRELLLDLVAVAQANLGELEAGDAAS